MKKIELHDITRLCERFKVNFNISCSDGLIYYHFGDIKWALIPTEEFNYNAYYEVSLRLAAKYPDKIYDILT